MSLIDHMITLYFIFICRGSNEIKLKKSVIEYIVLSCKIYAQISSFKNGRN